MLRLRQRAGQLVASDLLKRHATYQPKLISTLRRPYSTTSSSEEQTTPDIETKDKENVTSVGPNLPAKKKPRSIPNSIRARRRELRLLKAEEIRTRRAQSKATLTPDGIDPLQTSDPQDGTKTRRKSSKSKTQSAVSASTPADDAELDRSLVQEANQDAGGLSNWDALGDSQTPMMSGTFMSLQERLGKQTLADSSSAPSFVDTTHLGVNAGGYRVAEPVGTVGDLVVTEKQKKHSNAKGKVDKEKSKNKAEKTKKLSTVSSSKEQPASAVKSKNKRKGFDPAEVHTIDPTEHHLHPVETDESLDVPRLAHNLDRVLFNSGVWDLQQKRSRVYNFDPYLSTIMPVDEFDFNALKEYITSSKDTRLRTLSAKHGMKFCGSTSSMTAILSHFHFLLSNWRAPNFKNLSNSFEPEFQSFTQITRGPAAAFARLKDGVYAIDADKEFDTANILSMLGKSMEKLLTLPKEEFEKYRREHSHQISEEERNAEEAFHYTTFGDFMLRSQLDAQDPRLPGTGMFDLKTRAVVSIRMDVGSYEKGVGYEISHRYGQWESYEREYYDMIRSAFLKYSLQVRMGRMDGIFVAYHNTQRIFGFQYISVEEMDFALHGTTDRRLGDEEFRVSLALLNDVLNRAAKRFPGRSLRLHVETRPTDPPLTYFFAEPVSDEQMEETQAKGKASVEKFEREVLGLSAKVSDLEGAPLVEEPEQSQQELSETSKESPRDDEILDAQSSTPWDELMAKVDETVENESLGIETVRDAIEEALEHSGLLKGKSAEEVESHLDRLVEALSSELPNGKGETETSETTVGEEAAEDGAAKQVLEEEVLEEEATDGSASNAAHLVSNSRTTSLTDDSAIDAQTSGPVEASKEQAVADSGVVEHAGQPNEVGKASGISETDGKDSLQESQDSGDQNPLMKETALAQENNLAQESDPDENRGAEQDIASRDETITASLKELILQVAEGVDNKTGDMGAFEEMLSRLAEQAKEAVAKPQVGQSAPTQELNEAQDVPEQQEEKKVGGGQEIKESSSEEPEESNKREIFGVYITVQNKLNNRPVERVDKPLQHNLNWSVEYTVTELPQDRAARILDQIKKRRRKVFFSKTEDRDKLWHKLWKGDLARRTAHSKQLRKVLDKMDRRNPTYGAWDEKPIQLEKTNQPSKKKNNSTNEASQSS